MGIGRVVGISSDDVKGRSSLTLEYTDDLGSTQTLVDYPVYSIVPRLSKLGFGGRSKSSAAAGGGSNGQGKNESDN